MTAREIAALFEDLELRLIASLKRNLARHKAEEKDEGFDWPAWQAEKLHSLQRFRRENKSIMAEYSDPIDAETRALMRRQFAEADGSAGAFFGVNARKLDALRPGWSARRCGIWTMCTAKQFFVQLRRWMRAA